MSTKRKQRRERGERGREGEVWKGLAAGVAGGLVAAAVMNQFQALLSKLAAGEERSHGAQSMQQGSPRRGVGRELQAEGKDDPEDDAPERLANAVAVGVYGGELTEHEKEVAGVALHYAMGATSGALYGAAAEVLPELKVGAGLPFGIAVWLIADEGIVPAAGLSKAPSEYPLSVHAYSFASHLVFGLTTEVVRRAVRGAL
jgi:putative membrane protein